MLLTGWNERGYRNAAYASPLKSHMNTMESHYVLGKMGCLFPFVSSQNDGKLLAEYPLSKM